MESIDMKEVEDFYPSELEYYSAIEKYKASLPCMESAIKFASYIDRKGYQWDLEVNKESMYVEVIYWKEDKDESTD